MKGIGARRPSPAFVLAFIALLVALGGTGYAALKVPKGSVGTKQLKKNAVTTKKIANNAVTTSKIADNAVTASKVSVTLAPASPLTLTTHWSAPNDGEAAASCYQDREGIVHFAGGIHSEPGAQPTMATLPAACPPPPSNVVVQVPGNLGTGVNNDPYIVQITINSNGTLTNPAGTAGNGTAPKDNLTLASVTFRAR